MNHKRLLNALAKVGATITNTTPNSDAKVLRFRAVGKNGKMVCWYAQPHWQTGELEAVSVHTPDPQTDIMTDLFMDFHHKSIKSAAAELS
jgi:hypothetical protein